MNKYACMTLVCILSCVPVAFAQVSLDNVYQTRYSDFSQGDSPIRIVNTGARGGVSATGGPGGEICANVYGFAPSGLMASCCTCLVRPNGLVSLSVFQDLLFDGFNPQGNAMKNAVVINLLATVPVAGTCPGASTVFSATLAPGLAAWGATPQPAPGGASETAFTPSTLSASELNKLAVSCAAIHNGAHSCRSCPP